MASVQPFSELCLQSLNSLNSENLTLNATAKAFSALYIYDYLLTVADEVKYVWKAQKSWLFPIYVLNRYATMGLVLLYSITSRENLGTDKTQVCFQTMIVDEAFLVCITLSVEAFMTLKVYEASRGNWCLTGVLVSLMVSQLILGILSLVWSIVKTPTQVITLPDCEGVYRRCALGGKFHLAYTPISLVFATILLLYPWKLHGRFTPTLHRSVYPDRHSDSYFLFMLSIQIFVTAATCSGSGYPRALFPIMTNVFIPLMVSRIVLALRKEAHSQARHDNRTAGNLTIAEPGESPSAPSHELQLRKRAGFPVNAE